MKNERIWFADIEAYSLNYYNKKGDIKPYALIAKDLNGEFIFDINTEEFFEKLFSQEGQLHRVYFHYGGGYDFKFFLSYLKKRAEKLKSHTFSFFSKDKTIYFMNYTMKKEQLLRDKEGKLIWTGRKAKNGNKIYKKRKYTKKFTFVDTFRLWPFSLADLGKAVNLKKLDYGDYDITEEFHTNQDYIEWQGGKAYEYLHRDVDIPIKFYNKTKELFNINENYTLSSAAFKEMTELNTNLKYSRRWLESLSLWKILHGSFYGGFTWVNPKHQLKKVYNTYKYDVNSLYPYIMRHFALPFGQPVYTETEIKDRVRYYEISFDKATAKSIPFMSKGKKEKILQEVLDKINEKEWEEFSDLEEEYPKVLLKQKRIISSTMLEKFEKWYDIENLEKNFICEFRTRYGMFDDYIDKWSQLKQKYDKEPALRLITKLFQNSTFGRFAMGVELNKGKIEKMETLKDWGEEIRETKKQLWVNNKTATELNDGYVFYKERQDIKTVKIRKFEETQEIDEVSYIPIAEQITALARWETLKPIIENGLEDNLVYADTDSLHTTTDIEKYINIHQTKLGAWKREGISHVSVYRRPKHYLNLFTEENGEITQVYSLKGGGFDVKSYNNSFDISIDKYLQESFTVKGGKKGKMEVYGKPIIIGTDYTFTMPQSYLRRKK